MVRLPTFGKWLRPDNRPASPRRFFPGGYVPVGAVITRPEGIMDCVFNSMEAVRPVHIEHVRPERHGHGRGAGQAFT